MLDVAGDVHSSKDFYSNSAVICPVGSIMLWGGTAAPAGWLIAQGQEVSRTTYAALFAVLGTAYGVGNGTSTFNLPDMRGRVAVGVDTADINFNIPGAKFGTKTHTLTGNELPAHKHGFVDGSHSILWGTTKPSNITFGVSAIAQSTQGNNLMTSQNAWSETLNFGGGQPHNNIQPSISLNHIIRAL